MFRICKNAPLQWIPAGTYAPVPARASSGWGRACDAGRVPPAKKRHQREASTSSGHFIPQDVTG